MGVGDGDVEVFCCDLELGAEGEEVEREAFECAHVDFKSL